MSGGGSKPGERRGGRKKGTPNKTTALLKDAILTAGDLAGGNEGLVGYLHGQAIANPGPFMSLLGKVLPTQVTGDPENPLHLKGDMDDKFAAVVGALESAARAKQGGAGGESGVDTEGEAPTTDASRRLGDMVDPGRAWLGQN